MYRLSGSTGVINIGLFHSYTDVLVPSQHSSFCPFCYSNAPRKPHGIFIVCVEIHKRDEEEMQRRVVCSFLFLGRQRRSVGHVPETDQFSGILTCDQRQLKEKNASYNF